MDTLAPELILGHRYYQCCVISVESIKRRMDALVNEWIFRHCHYLCQLVTNSKPAPTVATVSLLYYHNRARILSLVERVA